MKRNPYLWAGLFALALFFALFGSMAHAQPTTNYDEVFRFDRMYDSWTLDSAYAVLFEGSSGAEDSGLRVPYDTARWGGRKDTLTFIVNVNATTISKTRNPSLMMCVYPSTLSGKPLCETHSLTHLIHAVDTARSANASLVIDSSSLAAIIAAINAGLGGSGDYPESLFVVDTAQDALVMGARVFVFAVDTTCCQNGSGGQHTDLNGRVIYSLDAGTFPVAASAHGLFMESAYQMVTQAIPGGRDTIKLYSYSFTPPLGSDSCLLVIFTDVPFATAEFTTSSTANQSTSAEILDVTVPIARADGNGTIQQSLPRTASTQQKTKWNVTVKNRSGKVMLRATDVVIPSQSIDTLLVKSTP